MRDRLSHEFVEAIPDQVTEGTLYVSMGYATAVHKCCCGCGQEVVTPLSPTDWKLIYDGVSLSLSPSIGNWSFKCQSHYWIERNVVRQAPKWSSDEIAAGRARDKRLKNGAGLKKGSDAVPDRSGFLRRLLRKLLG